MKCNICGGELGTGESVCKYCGNIINTSETIDIKPPLKKETPYQPRVTEEKAHTETGARVFRQPDVRNSNLYCVRCGRPLDGVTGKCIVCESEMVGRNTQVYSKEEYNMAKKKKKKKNSARNITLSIIGLIVLFSATLLFSVGPLSEYLGIGGQTSEPDVIKPVQTQKATKEPEWEPERDNKETEKPEKTEKPTKAPIRTAAPKETGDPVELRGGEYEYKSHTHLITEAELDELTRQEIKYIYWEIYARHGYTFDGELADYFETNHSWYIPTETDIAVVEAQFNDIEKRNQATIFNYLKKKGWR